MPINEKTGRALRKKMSASELFAYRLRQQAIRKGKQPARGPPQRDAGAGSGASPAAMLSAPELESGSSYSPAEASERPGLAGARKPRFCVEVPALRKTIRRRTAHAPSTSTAPFPTSAPASADTPAPPAPAPILIPVSASIPADTLPRPDAPTPAAIAPAPVPTLTTDTAAPLATAAAPTPTDTSPAVALGALLSTTDSLASGPRSSCVGSPKVAPNLRRFLEPGMCQAHEPTSPSRRLGNDTDTPQSIRDSDLDDRIRALVGAFKEWKHEDEEWKCNDEEWKHGVEERLMRLGV